MKPLLPSSLLSAPAIWLLEVEWAGRVYRWASALPDGVPVEITDAAGVAHKYRGGIDPSWLSEFALFAESSAPPKLSINLWFDALDNVPQRVADGDDLSAMTASLYRWIPSIAYEDRLPVFYGLSKSPSYGGVNEPVSVTFESPVYRDGATATTGRVEAGQIALAGATIYIVTYTTETGGPFGYGEGVSWPAPSAGTGNVIGVEASGATGTLRVLLISGNPPSSGLVVTGATSGATATMTPAPTTETISAADLSTGAAYPLVFGAPSSDAPRSEGAGSPGYVIDAAAKKVLAGVYLGTAPGAALYNVGEDLLESSTQALEVDYLGRSVVVVTSTAAGWDPEAEYALKWSGDPMGAGDLIAECARMSTRRVDHSLMATVRQQLNQYKFSGYVDQAGTSMWDWCLREVIALLPCSAYHSPEGLAVRVWDDTATSADAKVHLTTGAGCVRIGPIQYEGSVVNEVTVKYDPNRSGKYQGARTITGRIGTDSAQVVVSPYAMASVSRMAALDAAGPMQGVRARTITSDFVDDSATALRIASWMIRASAHRRRVITVEVSTGHLEWLEEAEHVTITDTETALSAHLAMIRARRWTGGRFFLEIVLQDDLLA